MTHLRRLILVALCLVPLGLTGISASSEGPSSATVLRGTPNADGGYLAAGQFAPFRRERPSASELGVPSPTGEVGTPMYSATATWCRPRGNQCQGWDGDVRLAALPSFRYGDERYWIRVWHGQKHVDALAVSYCHCPGNVDLSPAAFSVLASLDRGRIEVVVEDLRGVANDPLPRTDGEVQP